MISITHLAAITEYAARHGCKLVLAGDQERSPPSKAAAPWRSSPTASATSSSPNPSGSPPPGNAPPPCACARETPPPWTTTTSTAASAAPHRAAEPCLPGLEIGATCGGHHALLGTLRSLTQCIRLYFSGRQGWVRSRAQLRLFGRGGLLVPETRRLGQLPARRRIWPGCRLWRCSRKALGDLSVAEIAGMYPACSAAAPIILPEPISVTPVFAVIALAGDARCPPGSPNSRSRNQGPRPAPRQPQARHRA